MKPTTLKSVFFVLLFLLVAAWTLKAVGVIGILSPILLSVVLFNWLVIMFMAGASDNQIN